VDIDSIGVAVVTVKPDFDYSTIVMELMRPIDERLVTLTPAQALIVTSELVIVLELHAQKLFFEGASK
jgi:hypothetical protein